MTDELTNLGLSDKTHGYLKNLQEDGHFSEMRDAYRFAIALALSKGVTPNELPSPRTNIFGVATIDPDKHIYNSIKLLLNIKNESVYKWAERLAEWGVEELHKMTEKGRIDFVQLVEQANSN